MPGLCQKLPPPPVAARLKVLFAWLLMTAAVVFNPVHADRLEFDVKGIAREALVHAGRKVDTAPAPLVILFHGRGDNAHDFSTAVRLHKDWPEAIVAYPQGLTREDENGQRGWLGAHGREDSNHDLALVDKLLEELPRRYPVNPRQIYAGGFSNGGRLTFVLWAHNPTPFAGFVVVGSLSPELPGVKVPRPIMYLFGRDEPAQYQDAWSQTVLSLVARNRSIDSHREWARDFYEFPASEGGASTIINRYKAGHIWPHQGNRHIIRFFSSLVLDPENGN
jgi:polyhydroxybutyrate depolymerase